jgi:signal transduction histidine kinase
LKRRANSQTSRKYAAPSDRARQEIVRFDSLVDEFTEAMAFVPADAVDSEIEVSLGKICRTLNLDRSEIYERDAPDRPLRLSHAWLRANIPPLPRNFDPEKFLPETVAWVMAGKLVTFSRGSEIPIELADARKFVNQYGPKASAIIPMWAGGRVIGAASFGRFRSREWHPDLLKQLVRAVRILGGAIERKQAEAAARAVHAELALAQRRSMMGELVASIAHELNRPLGAIMSNLGGLERLMSQQNLDLEVASRAIRNAIEDTKRAGEVVRRIRGMFTGDGTQRAMVDVSELASEVLRLTRSEATVRQIVLETEFTPSVPPVVGDRILLQQCILNLLVNAFDALGDVESDQRKVSIRIALEKLGWISISVRDTGAGIHPSVAGRLFEPFVTTKSNGMGLGLLVTRSIVEDHGGKIRSDSNAHGGARFTITLPAAEGKRAVVSRRSSRRH